MSQKLPVNKFEWIKDNSKFNECSIQNYNEESNKEFFLEVDVQYPEKLHELYNNISLLPERIKSEKVEKLVTNLHDKTVYFIQIRNLKQALNHELILKKNQRMIKFDQKSWLKLCISMNNKLRQKKKKKITLIKIFSS